MDIVWKNYFGSAGDFILAQIRNEAVVEAANKVQVVVDGQLLTVARLIKQCEAHGWNSQIYEAWALETASRIRVVANKLTPIQAEALMIVGKYSGYFDVNSTEAYEAIHEAMEAMYGHKA